MMAFLGKTFTKMVLSKIFWWIIQFWDLGPILKKCFIVQSSFVGVCKGRGEIS